jgi:hypothetical protein
VTKSYRDVERPQGTGEIFQGEKRLGTVRYSLVMREVFEVFDGQELAEHPTISGEVVVAESPGMLVLNGEYFTLRLDDNRCLDLTCTAGDPISKKWTVIATGPNGFVNCCGDSNTATFGTFKLAERADGEGESGGVQRGLFE